MTSVVLSSEQFQRPWHRLFRVSVPEEPVFEGHVKTVVNVAVMTFYGNHVFTSCRGRRSCSGLSRVTQIDQHAVELRGALFVRDVFQGDKQLFQILLVGSVNAGIAGRADPRRAAEGVYYYCVVSRRQSRGGQLPAQRGAL